MASQRRARRNALLASAQLAAQRRERQEVERFLAAHAVQRATPRPVASGS